MSSVGDGPFLVDEPVQSSCETIKKSKITYSRGILLSLSELDICKKLPSGFDESILSEFEDSSQDRQRVSSTFLSHGFRRGEYGSSPPTRGDSGNYSWGMHGRWDSRSSGKSDKDSDSQSDLESDSGRRHGTQSRRGWQAPEHDGLLGSGNFPTSSSYNPAASVYPLNRSTEPYHPPRPCKAVPHPRSSANDSFNDETFGSSELASEDRAEEERKRRASFDLLRKEQEKAFQERQNIGKPRVDLDITTLMKDPTDVTHLNNQIEPNQRKAPLSLSTDSQNSSVPIQILGARPLVPPGFTGTMLEKKFSPAEAKGLMPDYTSSPAANDLLLNGSIFSSKEKKVYDKTSLTGKKPSEVSSVAEPIRLDGDIMADDEVAGQSGHPDSILEKIFGNALTLDENAGPLNFKPQRMSNNGTQTPQAVHSSKFVHLFPEGGKESTENPLSDRSSNLLSLIFGGEKAGSTARSEQSWPNSLITVSQPGNEQIKSNALSTAIKSPEGLCSEEKMSAVPPVLTCEDLENSILSEFSEEGGPKVEKHLEIQEIPDAKAKQRRTDVDNHASQHLLSLLQKGGLEDIPVSPSKGAKLSEHSENRHADVFSGLHNTEEEEEISQKFHNVGQTSTLETLCGSAFMKALQSDGAPVSAQGAGSAGLDPVDPHESHIPMAYEKLMSSLDHDFLSSRNMVESDVSGLSGKWPSLNMEEQHLIDDIQIEADKAQFRSKLAPKASDIGQPEEVQLAEDDSFVAMGDLFNLHGKSVRSSNKAEFPSYSSPFVLGGPYTALDSLFKDRKYLVEQGVPSFPVPCERRESNISLPNVQNLPFSPQVQPHGMNNIGPIHNSQDSYAFLNNPYMKRRDSMPHHGLPRSMLHPIHHPNAGFDPPVLPPMIQQMHPPDSFPLSHQLQGTAGGPRLAHPNQQISGLMKELSSGPGFPFGHQQPSLGRMPLTAAEPGISNNHPEALQRLFEMELRSKGKPANPFHAAAASHGQGLYGHDLDSSFRYR